MEAYEKSKRLKMKLQKAENRWKDNEKNIEKVGKG